MDQLVEFASNNALLVAALVTAALAVIFNELRMKARGLSAVGTADAVRLINDNAIVVDVRDSENYRRGHIVDARNIAKDELLAGGTDKLKMKKGVLLVCDNGTRSAECANALRKSGAENIFSLKGGLNAWRQDNLPVVGNATDS